MDASRHEPTRGIKGSVQMLHDDELWLAARLPLYNHVVLLSGCASYELIQKCIMAGLALVCAISVPSSYAVELARRFGVTRVGFLREGRFNIYSGPQRIEKAALDGDIGVTIYRKRKRPPAQGFNSTRVPFGTARHSSSIS